MPTVSIMIKTKLILFSGHPPPQKFAIAANVTEVGTDPAIQGGGGQCLLLPPAPFLYPRHCVLAHTEGIVTLTPSHREAETFVNNQRIFETTILQVSGESKWFFLSLLNCGKKSTIL